MHSTYMAVAVTAAAQSLVSVQMYCSSFAVYISYL